MSQPPFGHQPPQPGYGQQPPPPGYGQQPPPPPGYGQQHPGYGAPSGQPAYGQPFQQTPGGQPQQPGQWGHQPPPQQQQGGSNKALKWGAFGAAGVVALGVVTGGAVLAYNKIGGGGAQPEAALPASAIAFAKVDLDPSADQKVDAFRFARKFPGMRDSLDGVDENGDLRKEIFDAIKEDGGLEGVDYAQDVEPWLGQRFGVAILPPADGAQEPGVVVALASTDEDAAKQGLSKVTGSEGGYCSVQPDFAICGEEQSVVDKAVNDAKGSALADSDAFSQDMDDLGEDGMVTGWMDMSKAGDITQSTLGASAQTTQQGRLATALRFDGPTLELAGRMNGLPAGSVPNGDGTSVGDLPADTLGAVAVTGLDDALRKAWPEIDKNARTALGDDWQSGIDSFTSETGLSVPEDVAKAVGSDTAVAVGPNADEPKVALVTNGDKGLIDKLTGSMTSSTGDAPPVTVKDAGDGRTVVATPAGYADEIANGSGLGDSDAFKDAVPDADKAGSVAYVDISKAVELWGGDMDAEDKENIEPLSALGFAMWGEDDHADFTLRLTTK
jgi:hypothetical protein